MTKAKRNELCPCGSGKKFKKCCIPRPKPNIYIPQHVSETDVERHRSRIAGMIIMQTLALMDTSSPPAIRCRLRLEDLK